MKKRIIIILTVVLAITGVYFWIQFKIEQPKGDLLMPERKTTSAASNVVTHTTPVEQYASIKPEEKEALLRNIIPVVEDDTWAICGFQKESFSSLNNLFKNTYENQLKEFLKRGDRSGNELSTKIRINLSDEQVKQFNEQFNAGIAAIVGQDALAYYKSSGNNNYIERLLFGFGRKEIKISLDRTHEGNVILSISTQEPDSSKAIGSYTLTSKISRDQFIATFPESVK